MPAPPFADAFYEELSASGAAFASSEPGIQAMYYRALGLLSSCVLASPLGAPMLIEGGAYRGSWLESTATIGAETLSRFCPGIARSTFETFARLRRPDGLIPYKVLPEGPSYRQVQMVTPLSRSVWNHYRASGEDGDFILEMYGALSANDAWIAAHRDTRGSGGVEAFCAFDAGHDLSPRFWHCPDTTYGEDPAACDPDSPLLPFIAPDLTANVHCQRLYLARIARELGRGDEADAWEAKAALSLAALMGSCWDAEDEFFYDLDRRGRPVRVQSDVLLRVLACEIGDDGLFERALSRYLLNSRKFFPRYPFTSIAMDDPRFDPSSGYNTWGGATNVLSILRAPAAFEAHGRQVELSYALRPALLACSRMTRFGQCLSPWTGEEGYSEGYSPALLLALDAVERLMGILPRPGGELWFTALPPVGGAGADLGRSAYSRLVDGKLVEFECGPEGARAFSDGKPLFSCPRGVRVVADRAGRPLALVGMVDRRVEGALRLGGASGAGLRFAALGNEVLRVRAGELRRESAPGVVAPSY